MSGRKKPLTETELLEMLLDSDEEMIYGSEIESDSDDEDGVEIITIETEANVEAPAEGNGEKAEDNSAGKKCRHYDVTCNKILKLYIIIYFKMMYFNRVKYQS